MISATLKMIEIIPPNLAVRSQIDEAAIDALAWSMGEIGLIQAITVFDNGERYEIAAGHRRFLAAQKLGWTEIRAWVLDADTDFNPEAAKLHENLYREQISAVDEATYFAQLIEQGATEESLAATVRHPVSYIRARLKLLTYDQEFIEAVRDGKISVTVATVLMRCKEASGRHVLFLHAMREGTTAAIAAEWVQNQNYLDGFATQPAAKGGDPVAAEQADIDRLWHCILCGSDEDRYVLQSVMVHSYCLRALNQRIESEQNGQPSSTGDAVPATSPDPPGESGGAAGGAAGA